MARARKAPAGAQEQKPEQEQEGAPNPAYVAFETMRRGVQLQEEQVKATIALLECEVRRLEYEQTRDAVCLGLGMILLGMILMRSSRSSEEE